MMWDYWITLYIDTHCAARGLSTKTMDAYRWALYQFRSYVEVYQNNVPPDCLSTRMVLDYVQHLRSERHNGDSAVNRHVVILKTFYRAIVAMGHLEPAENPLAYFPKFKATPRKLPVTLSEAEISRLLDAPPIDTVLGLRDRAILALLYGTGIRASECAQLTDENVDLAERTITVIGKGGHMRTLPLGDEAAAALDRYHQARGPVSRDGAFFLSRRKRPLSRGAIYERVRTWSQRAKINKTVSPHRIRHTFATHLMRADTDLVTIRDLLGHRTIASTQIYLHVTAEHLRLAAQRHPISRLAPTVAELLPNVKLPFQHPPRRRQRPRPAG